MIFQRKTLLGILLGLILVTSSYFGEVSADISFITIDLSGTLNPQDFAVGMECGNPDFVYVTISTQGLLAEINKDTRVVTRLIDQPDEVVDFGQNFYSITRDPNTGKLYVIEDKNGELWQFDPSTTTWARIPLIEQVLEPNPDISVISYDFGYEVKPAILTIDERGTSVDDIVSYVFDVNSRADVKFANGNVWAALSYFLDFDEGAEELGFPDFIFFSGLAKIDPTTLEVTRIEIPGSFTPTGLAVDASDPNILWVADTFPALIYKFDTVTETVLETVDLSILAEPLGPNSNPLNLATDENNVYAALNRHPSGTQSETSFIARINKSTLDTTVIDTGAPNLNVGTFGVFVNNGLLVWTDQSRHVGIIDLSTEPPTVFPFETNTGTFAENLFGCVPVDGEFWFASKGSAGVGILPNSKFSGGRPVRATGSGGGGGGVYRGRDFAFGNPADPRYDNDAPSIEEVLIQQGSIKIVTKITDKVGVEGANVIIGKKAFAMSHHAGSQSWWYRILTADDISVSDDTLSVKIVAWDYNKNKAEHTVSLEMPFGAVSSTQDGASFVITALPVVGHLPDPPYSIIAKSVRTENELTPQITIKNTSNEPLQNIRLMLSPELKGRFLLSEYAVKSIAPHSEYTVSLELNGKPSVDAMNNPIPYAGHVIISVDNRTPYILEISGNIPNESASLQSLFMKMIAEKGEQRYKTFEKPDLRISQEQKYQVTLGSGETEIKSVLDELIITNNGEKALKNVRIMTSALSDHFLPDQKNIKLLPPGSFVKVKLMPKIDDALASKDIQGELLVIPENGNPVMVPINIGKKLPEDRNSMYEVNTLSGNNAVSNTVDAITIRNNSKEPIDNVRVILSQELARVFSISEYSFKSIEPNSEKTVYLQQRGTVDSKVRQILNDYRGEIIIASSDGMKKTIPVNIVWKGILSEHFVVYARDNARELTKATQVINFLERSYPKVTQIIDEVEIRTIIYMTSSLEEIKMLSDALAPSTYVYDEDIGFVWSNSEDLNMLALKEFAYRTIMQNYGTYWAKQKITLDKGNWLVDGIANYATASIVGERGMIKEQLDAFNAEPASFEWYGVSAPSQHGASYTLFKLLAEKYGDTIIDKILNNLGSTTVSSNRCETMEQCALLKAVYDANGWNMNDKRHDLSFVAIVEEWKDYAEEKYSIIMN